MVPLWNIISLVVDRNLYLQEKDYIIRILAEFVSNAFLSSWFNGGD